MAIDYYKRLLILKRETESDLDMIKSLAVTETQSLSNYIKRLVNYYGLNNDYLDVIYREDLKDKAREEVSILNEIFQELERKKKAIITNIVRQWLPQTRKGLQPYRQR